MLEINVGNITNQDNRKRAKWSMILGVLTFVFGIPSALSYGLMADVHIFGKTFFDAMDFLVSNLLMPFGALCLSLFTGYIFKKALAMEELHLDETPWKQGFFQVWLFLLRFIIPIYHHRGLYRPIYVNTKKDFENISQVFSFYGWLTINSKSCPSIVQASTSLGRIKWLPFWIG